METIWSQYLSSTILNHSWNAPLPCIILAHIYRATHNNLHAPDLTVPFRLTTTHLLPMVKSYLWSIGNNEMFRFRTSFCRGNARSWQKLDKQKDARILTVFKLATHVPYIRSQEGYLVGQCDKIVIVWYCFCVSVQSSYPMYRAPLLTSFFLGKNLSGSWFFSSMVA